MPFIIDSNNPLQVCPLFIVLQKKNIWIIGNKQIEQKTVYFVSSTIIYIQIGHKGKQS